MENEVLPGEWEDQILPEIWEIIAETCRKNAKHISTTTGAFELFGADIGFGRK